MEEVDEWTQKTFPVQVFTSPCKLMLHVIGIREGFFPLGKTLSVFSHVSHAKHTFQNVLQTRTFVSMTRFLHLFSLFPTNKRAGSIIGSSNWVLIAEMPKIPLAWHWVAAIAPDWKLNRCFDLKIYAVVHHMCKI